MIPTEPIDSILAAHRRAEHELIAANEALSESNARLRLAMDGAQLGAWELDAATDRITLGPRAAQIYGLQQGISYARSQVRELSHPQDAARVRQMLEQALAEHQHFNLEYRVLRRDGGVRWVASSGRGRYAPDGTLLGMTGVMQDITERKQAEAALRQNASLFAALVEQSPKGTYVVDAQLRIRQVNAQALPAFETVRPLIGRNLPEVVKILWGPEVGADIVAIFRHTLETGERYTSPAFHEHRHDLGVEQAYEWETQRVTLPDGEQGVACYFTDITERTRAAEALRASEAKLHHSEQLNRISFELAPVAIAHAGLDGRLIKVNAQLCQLTGYAADELIGMKVADLSHPQDRVREAEPLDALLSGKATLYESEKRYLRKDGGIRWVSVTARMVTDDHGAPVHSIGVVQDITDRKRFELELVEAKAAAEKSNLAKSEFLSSMSHELRSPLNSILGYAQLIEAGSPPPSPGQKASIDQILQAGWHLLALINEVLDLSLIESGKLSLSLQPLPLVDVLGECQALIEPQAARSDVRVSFHPLDGPGLIVADRTRTKQVLINLLTNAIKYNRTSGTVDVRCSAVDTRRVRISVEDTGQGMTPEQIAQLFQPFNRLGKECSAEEGTGIGLVVSKRLVEMMGGTIGARSVLGMGSEFWFELDSTCAAPHDLASVPASPLSLHTQSA